jgi:uncharacterized protein (TIGR00369 family)
MNSAKDAADPAKISPSTSGGETPRPAPASFGVVSRETLTAGDGLSFLRGLLDGHHPAPPFSRTASIYLTRADEGAVTFEGYPSEDFFNPLGTIHGGWASALLDSAMACAVHSTLKAGQGYTSVELKINFVRPILPGSGTLTCEGRVIHRGATLATAEGRILDAAGKLLAHGTETCIIIEAAQGRHPRA